MSEGPWSGSRFIDDIQASDLNFVVTVRSPVPRGRITSIRLPELPAGYRAVLASDIPGTNRCAGIGSVPLLAESEVRYAGEPVALIAGPNGKVLETLRAAAVVEVEVKAPFLSSEKFSGEQIIKKRILTTGDPHASFARAAKVIEGAYRTGSQYHAYGEPHGAVAIPSGGVMVVHSSTQWPYNVRDAVADALGADRKSVVVQAVDVGMHMDGKIWYPSIIAAHAAVAAVALGKPTKLLLSREEDFLYSPKRVASYIRHRTALDENGDILADETRIALNFGAYAPFVEEILDRICVGALGAYRCPNSRIEAFAVMTNLPPLGAFNGWGLSQAFFAAERHAARIAEFTRRDQVEWRTANLIARNSALSNGERFKDEVPSAPIFEALTAASDFRRKHAAYELLKMNRKDFSDGPLRGIGIGFCFQGNGWLGIREERERYSVEVMLDKESRLSILTSAVSGISATTRIWKQIAGEILTIPQEQVNLVSASTDEVPDSGPSTFSRNIAVITRLIERCCLALQKQRFRDPLPITIRRYSRVSDTRPWDAASMKGIPFALYSWAGAVVEIEIDPVLAKPSVRHIWICVDGGRILSRDSARHMIETGAINAYGWAACEVLPFSDGRIPPETFYGYGQPAFDEIPPIEVSFIEGDRNAPVKGVGDLPFNCVPAAYCAALSQATGSSFDTIPVTGNAVFARLENE